MNTISTNPHATITAVRPVSGRFGDSRNPFVEIPRSQRVFIGICVTAYALLVCVLGLLDASRMTDQLLLLSSSVALIFVIAAPIILNFEKSGFLHPLVITSAFALMNILLRKTDVLARGLEYHYALPGYSSKSLTELVLFVNVLGIVGFLSKYAGYYCCGNVSFSAVKLSTRPNALFMPLLVFWFVLGMVCLALIINTSGGINYHLKNINRGDQHKVFSGDTALLGTFAFIVQSTIVAPLLYAAFRKNGHKSLVFIMMVAISGAMVYLTAGRRSALLAPVYLAIGVWIFKERKLPLVRIFAVGFALFLFLAVGSLFRDANRRKGSQVDWDFMTGYSVSQLAEISLGELSDRSGNSAAIYPIIVQVPKRQPFNYFKSYAENVYRFIPRSLWPAKPEGIGIECAEVFYGRVEQGGIPPGPYGEAYWSLGIFGVIAAFFAFGMLLKILGNHFKENPKSIGILAIYLLTVLRLGPDQISFRIWIFSLVPTLLFLFMTNLLSLRGR